MLKLQLLHHQLRQSIQSHYTLLQFFTFHFIANRFSSSVHRRSWHGPPPFSNFLFTNLFSIKFLYFFIISSLFPYFNLFVDQYSYNLMLTSNCMCRPYIDTNNPQGMQLLRFKNRTPARFEYIYCTLFPLCHSN